MIIYIFPLILHDVVLDNYLTTQFYLFITMLVVYKTYCITLTIYQHVMLVTCNTENNMVVLYRGDHMNTATRKKLNEIVKLIEDGATEKDILSKKFKRDKSKMTAWINKLSSEFTLKEKELLSFEKYEIVKQSKEANRGVPVRTLEILEQHEKRLRDLELKLAGQNQSNNLRGADILHIDEDILKLKSVVRSIRINTDLTDQLNLIAEKHLNYSKTNLWNQMLSEFIEKYK